MQLLELLSRELKLYRRNLIILSIGSVLCLLFLFLSTEAATFDEYETALPIVFALSCAAILIGLMMSINLVCKDFGMIRRELRMGVTAWRIVLSKSLMTALLCSVMSLILSLPYVIDYYSIANQNAMQLYGSILFTMLAAAELALLTSVLCIRFEDSRMQYAAQSITFIMLFQILFSGFIFEQARIKLDRITISSYSIRAIGSSLRFDNEHFRWDVPHDAFDSHWSYLTRNFAVLTVFLIVSGVVATIILYRIDKNGGLDV